MKYRPVDLEGVVTYPLSERINKVIMTQHRAGPVWAGMTVVELMAMGAHVSNVACSRC